MANVTRRLAVEAMWSPEDIRRLFPDLPPEACEARFLALSDTLTAVIERAGAEVLRLLAAPHEPGFLAVKYLGEQHYGLLRFTGATQFQQYLDAMTLAPFLAADAPIVPIQGEALMIYNGTGIGRADGLLGNIIDQRTGQNVRDAVRGGALGIVSPIPAGFVGCPSVRRTIRVNDLSWNTGDGTLTMRLSRADLKIIAGFVQQPLQRLLVELGSP